MFWAVVSADNLLVRVRVVGLRWYRLDPLEDPGYEMLLIGIVSSLLMLLLFLFELPEDGLASLESSGGEEEEFLLRKIEAPIPILIYFFLS
jgi:hypothetical protein